MKNYYKILGLKRNASQKEIKDAFRTLAHEHHPDKNGGYDVKFKELNEAYQTLGNEQKRNEYDLAYGWILDMEEGQLNDKNEKVGCINCGKKINLNSKFCIYCGRPQQISSDTKRKQTPKGTSTLNNIKDSNLVPAIKVVILILLFSALFGVNYLIEHQDDPSRVKTFVLNEQTRIQFKQSCVNSYGTGSYWNGSLDQKGGPMCSCESGYSYSIESRSCIPENIINYDYTYGIGVGIIEMNDTIQINLVVAESPALSADLRTGDYILDINGKSTTFMKLDEALSLMRGAYGTCMTLKIKRELEPQIINKDVCREYMIATDIIDLPLNGTTPDATDDISAAKPNDQVITAVLKIPGAFRNCAQVSCKVIRYYAETASVNIIGIDPSREWYNVKAKDDFGNYIFGWMHYSLFEGDYRSQL